jgi:phosphate transport system substrate-binding protein
MRTLMGIKGRSDVRKTTEKTGKNHGGRLFLVAIFAAMLAAGCSTKTATKGGAESETTNLTGAGSSFVYPAMTRWISDYQKAHPNVRINYASIGSGGGIRQVKAGLVDFGASDAALSDQELTQMPPLVQIPESAGPVCLTYNLSQVKQPLRLTSQVVADIYLGKIKRWNDPALRKVNPGVNLPNEPIIVAHRSEGSGTTNIFTTYLSTVSPEWSKKVGHSISVDWPVGLGGKGNEGVTGIVQQNPGGFGYVELAYAISNHLPTALLENRAGKFVAPSAAGTTAALAAFADSLAKDVRNPVVDAPASAPEASPICGLTYLIVPKQAKSPQKAEALVGFIRYILTDGQPVASTLDYAPIPASIAQLDENLLKQVTAAKSQTP